MSTQHEELEVGHELDRAVRAAVTGLAQLMERYARRQQEQSREGAGREREEWLGRRDAARQQYLPWTAEGRLERLDWHTASKKWAAAAAWSGMDPTARLAEQDMAQRIMATHGQHPSVLIKGTDPKTLSKDPNPPARLLSMNEAYGLAATHAPSWYRMPDEVRPLETDRPPANQVEQAFHDDWQYYSEAGQLPERSQWERWADHVGRGDEFAADRWLTADDGTLDEEARDAALAQVWAEGTDTRTTTDIADHEAALHTARMGTLAEQVGPPAEVDAPPWVAYLTPSRFDAASADDLARAWRDASASALTGDVEARTSADKIATLMRERRGLNPEAMLIQALSEQAAASTEARRGAEDQVRKNAESTRSTPPLSSPADPTSTSTSTSGPATPLTRERVVELNELAADFYGSNLRPGTAGHRYFTDRLGPEFESGPWALGHAQPGWQNLTQHLRTKGVSDQEMVTAGLAEPGKFGVRDVFRDRAMMGIRDHATGDIVGFLGRDLSDDPRAPKVRNTGETAAFRKGDHVFGLHEAQPGARLVRVEGPFDAMAVHLASEGEAAGVTPMGTQMTDRQADAIVERANGRVWLANDTDEAGQKATESDFYRLSDRGADVRQVNVPGSDPAEAWKERPVLLSGTLAALPDAPSAAETVVDRYLASPEATREGFGSLMSELGAYVDDPVERQLLAARVDDLDSARRRRVDAESSEATQRAEHELVAGEEGPHEETGEEVSAPARAEAQERHDDALAHSEQELHAAEAATDGAAGDERAAYDRLAEARADMNENQSTAREGSSHGFSQSTEDQVRNAPRSGKGAKAKTQRSTGVKQTHGRTLRR